MTELEELQAKHRAEEAEARRKLKDRKARTRRLIQEGAILESILPEAHYMELNKLKAMLKEKLERNES